LNDGKHGRKRITGRDSMNGRTGMLQLVSTVGAKCLGVPVVKSILITAVSHTVLVNALDGL